MDSLYACRRAQYIKLVSEMQCLPKMPANHIVASLALSEQITNNTSNIDSIDRKVIDRSPVPVSLMLNILLMGDSIIELSARASVDVVRILACILGLMQDWIPILKDNVIKVDG